MILFTQLTCKPRKMRTAPHGESPRRHYQLHIGGVCGCAARAIRSQQYTCRRAAHKGSVRGLISSSRPVLRAAPGPVGLAPSVSGHPAPQAPNLAWRARRARLRAPRGAIPLHPAARTALPMPHRTPGQHHYHYHYHYRLQATTHHGITQHLASHRKQPSVQNQKYIKLYALRLPSTHLRTIVSQPAQRANLAHRKPLPLCRLVAAGYGHASTVSFRGVWSQVPRSLCYIKSMVPPPPRTAASCVNRGKCARLDDAQTARGWADHTTSPVACALSLLRAPIDEHTH